MGYNKAKVVVLMSIVVFMQVMGDSGGKARVITYGSLDRDEIPGCGPKHPENCQHQQSNPYTRGCLPFERCRHDKDDQVGSDFNDKVVADDNDMVQRPILEASGPASGDHIDHHHQETTATSKSSNPIDYNRHVPLPNSFH